MGKTKEELIQAIEAKLEHVEDLSTTLGKSLVGQLQLMALRMIKPDGIGYDDEGCFWINFDGLYEENDLSLVDVPFENMSKEMLKAVLDKLSSS